MPCQNFGGKVVVVAIDRQHCVAVWAREKWISEAHIQLRFKTKFAVRTVCGDDFRLSAQRLRPTFVTAPEQLDSSAFACGCRAITCTGLRQTV